MKTAMLTVVLCATVLLAQDENKKAQKVGHPPVTPNLFYLAVNVVAMDTCGPQTSGIVTITAPAPNKYVPSPKVQCTTGNECSISFIKPTQVSLQVATMQQGWFKGFADDCNGTTGRCSLTVDGPKRVTATFCAPKS